MFKLTGSTLATLLASQLAIQPALAKSKDSELTLDVNVVNEERLPVSFRTRLYDVLGGSRVAVSPFRNDLLPAFTVVPDGHSLVITDIKSSHDDYYTSPSYSLNLFAGDQVDECGDPRSSTLRFYDFLPKGTYVSTNSLQTGIEFYAGEMVCMSAFRQQGDDNGLLVTGNGYLMPD